MSSNMRWIVPAVVALGLFVWASASAQAQDVEKGSVAGKVVDKDGKGVANAQVRLVAPQPAGGGRGGRGGAGEGAAPAPRKQQLQDGGRGRQPPGGGRGQRPRPVATATTDADGKFAMKDVPVGDYTIVAFAANVGMGRANVQVEAGKEASVEIALTQPPPQRGGAGGRRGAGGGQ